MLHYPLWYLVNVGVLALIFWRLNILLQPALGDKPQRWLFWVLMLALAGRHVIAPLENHSHDLLVFLCVLLAIEAWCGAKAQSVGWWAGLGAALKATPLLFAPLLVWHRKWIGLAVMGASLAALTFLPDVLCPAASGASWTISWSRTFLAGVAPGESATLRNTWPAWTVLNQSLAGTIHRLVTPVPTEVARGDRSAKASDNRKGWAFNMPSGRANHDAHIVALSPTGRKWAVLPAQLAVLGWLAWVTRPALTRRLAETQRSFQRLGEGAALATAMVLLSPSSIKTHFCVLLLPVAFCLADFLYRRRDPFVGAMLGLTFVLGTLTVKDLLGVELGDRVLAYGSVTACTLGLYLATGRVLLQRSRCCQEGASARSPGAPSERLTKTQGGVNSNFFQVVP